MLVEALGLDISEVKHIALRNCFFAASYAQELAIELTQILLLVVEMSPIELAMIGPCL